MHPAREDVMWNFTRPGSAANASDLRGAMMSIPWCVPWPRASP